jgi:hypothetical protein
MILYIMTRNHESKGIIQRSGERLDTNNILIGELFNKGVDNHYQLLLYFQSNTNSSTKYIWKFSEINRTSCPLFYR